MRLEPVTLDTLGEILTWWELRGEGEMDINLLPPAGLCAIDKDGPCAAAWLYQPRGCKVAILDWLVTKPGHGLAFSRRACRMLFEALADMARADGAMVLFSSVSRPAMLREAQACGFLLAATDCTHLVKHL